MKDFSTNFANTFDISPTGSMMGVVTFASTARVRIDLSSSKTNVLNIISGMTRLGGGTCIHCGIASGQESILTYGRPLSTGVSRVTDGNSKLNLAKAAADTAKSHQILLFAIGIGSVNQNTLTAIASEIPNVQTIFTAQNFDALAGILDSLIQATCVEMAAKDFVPAMLFAFALISVTQPPVLNQDVTLPLVLAAELRPPTVMMAIIAQLIPVLT